MDLSKFVQSTICEIIRGVDNAKRELQDEGVGAAVNPVWDSSDNLNDQHVLKMEFDVAITVASASQTELGRERGIRVLSVDVDGKGQLTAEQSSVSRVKFSVPYIPPATAVVRPRPPRAAQVNYDPHDY